MTVSVIVLVQRNGTLTVVCYSDAIALFDGIATGNRTSLGQRGSSTVSVGLGGWVGRTGTQFVTKLIPMRPQNGV